MAGRAGFGAVLGFLTLYLALSVPPFLYLNREVLDDVLAGLTAVDPRTVVWLAAATFALVGLFRAQEGVERYTQFLVAPKNVVAVVVTLSFVVAATSWWAVLELAVWLDLGVTLNQLLVVILACQAPMVVLLSLLTVLGKAVSRE